MKNLELRESVKKRTENFLESSRLCFPSGFSSKIAKFKNRYKIGLDRNFVSKLIFTLQLPALPLHSTEAGQQSGSPEDPSDDPFEGPSKEPLKDLSTQPTCSHAVLREGEGNHRRQVKTNKKPKK